MSRTPLEVERDKEFLQMVTLAWAAIFLLYFLV